MADYVQITEGSGASIAADEIVGVKFQRVKTVHGADGTNDGDTSYANPFPVRQGQVLTTEDLVTIAYGTLSSSFASCGLSNVATSTLIDIWNDTDANVLFNFDNGANAEFIVPARAARSVPVKAGATQLYTKYASAPTAGNVYFEVRK